MVKHHLSITDSETANFDCLWGISQNTTTPSPELCWQVIDLTLRKAPTSTNPPWSPEGEENTLIFFGTATGSLREVGKHELGSPAAFAFLLNCLLATTVTNDGFEVAAKLILPQTQGSIARSDVISLRLVDCPLLRSVVSFSEPLQYFTGESVKAKTIENFADAFKMSVAGILLEKKSPTSSELARVESELHNRLSFPWISNHPKSRKTLAMLRGGVHSPEHGGTAASIFLAAKALGINIIVLDTPGHWLEGPKHAQWREAFIPIKVDHDDALPNRIVQSLNKYGHKVDGIVTFFESYAAAVARAAQELSLPTIAPETFEIITDKYRTSLAGGHKAYRASSLEEAMNVVSEVNLSYPAVVKPCRGWSSEGVTMVEHALDLPSAITVIDIGRHGEDFVIEEYCDGPEVDANLVLCDGELLLFEVSDDFPKGADVNGTGTLKTFIELANVLPSNLPPFELDILRDSLHSTLLQLGIRSGIYHLEARVQDSTMEYVLENGIIDLQARKRPSQAPPAAWLIEINPRPPGIQATDAVASTYGVDYWALGLLFAINDKERARALSRPFANGPQYWCEMVFIPVEHGGVFDSDDVCKELLQRRPDLAAHVSKSACLFKRGEQVPAPNSGLNAWVAYFNVFSRESRAHVLKLSLTVRRETRFSII